MLRTHVRSEQISWVLPVDYYKLLTASRIKKINASLWRTLRSSKPLPNQPITYIQLKIINFNSGYTGFNPGIFFFGISKGYEERGINAVTSGGSQICCMFNGDKIYDKDMAERHYTFSAPKKNDIIGMVVDAIKDETRFYINGRIAAVGKRKPSVFKPNYALLYIFDEGCELEVGDFIPYRSLEARLRLKSI